MDNLSFNPGFNACTELRLNRTFSLLLAVLHPVGNSEIWLIVLLLEAKVFREREEDVSFRVELFDPKSSFVGLLYSIFEFLDCNFGLLLFKSINAGLGILFGLISAGLYLFIEDFLFEDDDLYWLVLIKALSGVVMLQFREVSLKVVDTPL